MSSGTHLSSLPQIDDKFELRLFSHSSTPTLYARLVAYTNESIDVPDVSRGVAVAVYTVCEGRKACGKCAFVTSAPFPPDPTLTPPPRRLPPPHHRHENLPPRHEQFAPNGVVRGAANAFVEVGECMQYNMSIGRATVGNIRRCSAQKWANHGKCWQIVQNAHVPYGHFASQICPDLPCFGWAVLGGSRLSWAKPIFTGRLSGQFTSERGAVPGPLIRAWQPEEPNSNNVLFPEDRPHTARFWNRVVPQIQSVYASKLLVAHCHAFTTSSADLALLACGQCSPALGVYVDILWALLHYSPTVSAGAN
ncbi:hypothetical protein B0H19DRAFT_1322518 [Mycena capillaripes]|nr:hypothetical protein B0H19DRAFT_1322518 [Mycena capillaripes]